METNRHVEERRAMLFGGAIALAAGLALVARPAFATDLVGMAAPDGGGAVLLRWIGVLHVAIGLGYFGARASRRAEFRRATLAFGGLFQLVTLLVGCAAVWHVSGEHLRVAGALGAFGLVQGGVQWLSAWRFSGIASGGLKRVRQSWGGGDDSDDSLELARRWMAVLGGVMLLAGLGCLFFPKAWLPAGGAIDAWLLRWIGGFYVAAGLGHLAGFVSGKVESLRATMEITDLFQIIVGALGFCGVQAGFLPAPMIYVALPHLAAGLLQGRMLLDEEWRED